MDARRTDGGNETEHDPDSAVDDRKRPPVWSVRRLIELLDEAIDSAGAQLARSAGLWADSESEAVVAPKPRQVLPRPRPVRRSALGSRPSTADSLIEDSSAERELETP